MIKKFLLFALALSFSWQAPAQDVAAYRDQVQTMYVAYYGRPGDEGGIDFWANRLATTGGDLGGIIDAFGNSAEFTDRYGSLDTPELVNNIFVQLLGRNADTGGLNFYVDGLNNSEYTLASVALNVANGAQNSDVDVIANKLALANAFTTAYVAANVVYDESGIVYAKQLVDSVDSTGASLTAALASLNDTLALFPPAGAIRVSMQTNYGEIVIELYEDEAPITVANFLSYVDSDFYDELWFHRIVAGFVIQGGGFYLSPEGNQLLQKTPNAPIVNESSNGLSNVRGSLAMARTSDPDSATSQFYINLVANTGLDYNNGTQGYAVFGYVVSGMDVVDAIAAVPTFSNDIPTSEVKILSVTRLSN